MFPVRTILVPTDFSEPSCRAFQLACSLAQDGGLRVLVMHVIPAPVVMYGPPPEEYVNRLWHDLNQITTPDPKVYVEHLLAEGNPAAAILKTARETNCDAIVMGTHGRTGLDHLLMGSVAEEVVRKACCPVVTVKTPNPST